MHSLANSATMEPVTGGPLVMLANQIASVFRGRPNAVRHVLVALLSDGHALIEDVPGVGKTTLAKSLAKSLACSFRRIQFTPDLLPGDITGSSVYHPPSGQFQFHEGPLFGQVVLADEINRATPRTQSALLEAMSERQITLDGTTRKLGPPFLVLATQNPYEFEGTYPLPESQLDRFLLRIRLGYPSREEEKRLVQQNRAGEPVDSLTPILQPADVAKLQEKTRNVKVADAVTDYVLDILSATRSHSEISLGASPRAGLMLTRAAQATALIDGRDYCTPDDVKALAVAVLVHRLVVKAWDRGGPSDATPIVKSILDSTPVRL